MDEDVRAGVGPSERAHDAGGAGPTPERRRRMSARRKQDAVPRKIPASRRSENRCRRPPRPIGYLGTFDHVRPALRRGCPYLPVYEKMGNSPGKQRPRSRGANRHVLTWSEMAV